MIEEQTPPRTDFYLRLNSEADMPTVLAAFDRQISIVGTIHKPTGVTLTDADGNDYPETAPLSGHHVNVRIVGDAYRDAVEALDATNGVIPQQPVRVWA
jgi:hypothetical protein